MIVSTKDITRKNKVNLMSKEHVGFYIRGTEHWTSVV